MDALKRNERHEWVLEGLDCANCALKIENGVSKIEGVLDCSVNFVTKTLTMTTTSDQKKRFFAKRNGRSTDLSLMFGWLPKVRVDACAKTVEVALVQ